MEDLRTRVSPRRSAKRPHVAEASRLCVHASPRGREQRLVARRESLERDIRRMVRRIVRRFHPDKIILFGSQARGDAAEDSDVDLLVVMPVEGNPLDKVVEIRMALHSIKVSKDVLLVSPEMFDKRKDIVGTVPFEASQCGKTLYARNA